jgi:nitrogen fixation/metabolism regulation signal transduction histidine kinase
MLKNINVMYVEDDLQSNNLICELLQPEVKLIKGFLDPLEAIEEYESIDPEVILVDIKIPQINGFEFIEKIKQKNPDQSFIIVSAFNNPDFFQKAISMHIDGYILKPVDLDELVSEINRIVQINHHKQIIAQKDAMLLSQSRQAAMGEMIGMIAHQWKQPLNSISVTMSSLIVKADLQEPITHEDIYTNGAMILDQVNYLSNTIDEFRDYLKPNKTKEEVFISNVISDALRIVGKSLENHAVKINQFVSSDILLHTYRKELVQIFLNILNNAKDAFILNETKNHNDQIIKLIVEQIDDKVEISISDNAGGIDPNIIESIFEPYISSKPADMGTGIGLYMVKTLLENHLNGSIEAYNDNEGAVFKITLAI